MNNPNNDEPMIGAITFLTNEGKELLFQGVHYNVFIEGLLYGKYLFYITYKMNKSLRFFIIYYTFL
jgi:hypothetical protein